MNRSRIKGGWPGQKKRRPELIIVKMAVLAKAKVTLVFWTQALSHN